MSTEVANYFKSRQKHNLFHKLLAEQIVFLPGYLRKVQVRSISPVVDFFDLESIIEPVMSCPNETQFLERRIFEVHKPCSYAVVFIAQGQDESFHLEKNGPRIKAEVCGIGGEDGLGNICREKTEEMLRQRNKNRKVYG